MAVMATIRIEDSAELVHKLRVEMANILRQSAEGEITIVRKKMNEAADTFETGIKPGDVDG